MHRLEDIQRAGRMGGLARASRWYSAEELTGKARRAFLARFADDREKSEYFRCLVAQRWTVRGGRPRVTDERQPRPRVTNERQPRPVIDKAIQVASTGTVKQLHDNGFTFQEIGKHFGFTRQRAHQLYHRQER